MNPVAQTHVPEAEHTPAPAHGGEHADDWMSRSSEMEDALDGSCDTSGTLSQNITRLFEEPEENAAQTLDERAREPAETLVLLSGVAGSCVNWAWPEYFASG